jgi:DNA-binding GntR family transcriptional regulator
MISMKKELDLGYQSLKNLVYQYIRDQMKSGELKQGDTINMEKTSQKLGVSKTPLREALIKLEAEGFVRIVPWRGVFVSELTLQDFKDCYQIIGALECSALLAAAPLLKKREVARMAAVNVEMREAIGAGDFDRYYERNLEFHRTYLDLASNRTLSDTVDILKKKLYEFSRPKEFLHEWEEVSMKEHERLVEFLAAGRFRDAADYLRNTIWSFEVQRSYIVKYYKLEERQG